MKKSFLYITTLFMIINRVNAYAQCNNLVQNGDFENYTTCPSGMVQINVATPWDRLGLSSGTSDYFNSCAGSSGANGTAGTPQNGVGMQIPFSGNGYAGLITYLGNNASGNPPPNPNYREYISQPLSSAMIVGQTYQVSFYVSLSEKQRYAADGMGAYFSTVPIVSANNLVLPFTPQVSNSSGNILTDTLGWTQISQNFVATQPFAYITIGSFSNGASTQFVVSNSSIFAQPVAYYYIDDVSVVCLTCCVLPVKLLSFRAESNNINQVKLNWTTVSEINNAYFAVQRSQNGIDFSTIENIAGEGNSNLIISYEYYDNFPFQETSYYRLKQVDFDGNFSFSNTVVVKLVNSVINVYPNPVANQLIIKGNKKEISSLAIYNVLGENVTSLINTISKNSTKHIVNISSLPAGVYTVRTKTTTTKIVKR